MSIFFWKIKESQGNAVLPQTLAERASIVARLNRAVKGFPGFLKDTIWRIAGFVILLLFYVASKVVLSVYCRVRGLCIKGDRASGQFLFARFYSRIARLFRIERGNTIDKISLIEIAIRNMRVKKTRTAITIGGMALGIGSIVFLVSLGYGLQRLVISQVARLEEMRQADVSPQPGGKVRIDDRTLSSLSSIPGVESVAPLVAVVGRVNYQNSVSDMAVYGVTSDYLADSAIRASSGRIFDANQLVVSSVPETSTVAGESVEAIVSEESSFGPAIAVSETVSWVRIREKADVSSALLGYARISPDPTTGEVVRGASYGGDTDESETDSRWFSVRLPLWEKGRCEPEPGICESGFIRMEQMTEGYFALVSGDIQVSMRRETVPRVLGDETEAAEAAAASTRSDDITIRDSGEGWVDIVLDGEASSTDTEVEQLMLGSAALREAVVNTAMLRVLGIDVGSAIGRQFSVSFVVTGNLLEGKQKAESVPADYTIVGVISDDQAPLFYVPFIDLRTLGISNYSQTKITAATQEQLPSIRRQVEGMGYISSSVSDTVEQINQFFGTARIVLGLLGMAALGVAALGMFNTLTVSLLERTREVGLMKAMGMKSVEVQELFLTESMVMAFFGGVAGLLVGFLAGKGLGLAISALAFFRDRGLGVLDVSYVPPVFVLAILVFSIVVGILTGLYPARRATHISALNALRYE